MVDINEGKDLLTSCNQQHLLKYWDEINDEEKSILLNEIKQLNIPEACEYFKSANTYSRQAEAQCDSSMKPVPSELYGSAQDTSSDILKSYREIGLQEISEGHVGVILLAGGQGTRIGVPYPKGMYKVGLPSDKSLFQIQAERIMKLESLAFEQTGKKSIITWFIMTSESTMEPTKNFFEENKYFGLQKDNVIFFEQGVLPCFTFDGKIIMDSKFKIAKAPDGNGGIYIALKKKGILSEMEKRGIEYVHVYSVDNILVKVADPVFMGFCVKSQSDCGVKVVEKKLPNEGLGVVCVVDGQYKVVEYSEISSKTAELRDADGKLTFRAGNICNHFFSTAFLGQIANEHESKLKLHIAKKKIPYIDSKGLKVKPEQPNGIKIEKFIFDVFEFCKNLVVWEVAREHDFSALKNSNAEKTENPTTCCLALYDLHKSYIEAAGGTVKPDAVGNVVCEISPSVSYDGEGLKPIVNGNTFESPILLK
ncbi:UDP-N-acetylhexosamine pyrophosphorylase-like protein 1 [Diaphorina citri]|jgi:UDP-glucose pyrophosphorylase|uniref:UDP-N-acetylglucosamine diphosphorylase n=1 Tax=Diaphorina citri TaxID=121845 RepID=A0A1S3DT95_DIACI|nr:UDP-N-acetylhexosamine pyrophosphorylase-like protein 1 [Diaphorina citri]